MECHTLQRNRRKNDPGMSARGLMRRYGVEVYWKIVAMDGRICQTGDLGASRGGKMTLPPYTALILAKEK